MKRRTFPGCRASGAILSLLSGGCLFAAEPATPPSEPQTMRKLTVAAEGDEPGVIAEGHSASSKTDIPLIEMPQAISVVTAETIKEQGITRLGDALRAVAGVARSSTYGYYDAYTLRGYDAAYGTLYLDGLTTTSPAGAVNELAGLEQVEVVKGPASALFGASPLGGIVNMVSKRPRADAFIESMVTTGSYGLIESSIDANAPLNESGALLARMNVLYRDSDDFVDYSGENRLYVAPALTWNIGDDTHLMFLGRYQRDHDSPWSPVSAYGTILPSAHGKLPVDFSVNRNGAERTVVNQHRRQIGYLFDHRFNEALSFSQTLRYAHTKTYWNNWVFSDGFVDGSFVDGVQQGHVLGLLVYGPYRHVDNDFAVDSRFSATFATASVSHSVLAGVDLKNNRSRYADEGGNFDSTVNTLDILAPDQVSPLIHDAAFAYSDRGQSRQAGYYLQDHVSFTDRLFMTVGGRWDEVDTDGNKEQAFSPNGGVNYFIAPTVSLYANVGKSFTPQFGWVVAFDGSVLPPETGRNIEGGIKFDRGAFKGLISLFQLTRRNVATSDPDPTHPFAYVVTGEQRSRGLEVEGGWTPNDAWSTTLAYAYIDAEVTQDNSIPAGTRLSSVPKHNIYLRGEYVVRQGALANLGLSLAVLYNSDRNSSLYLTDMDGDGDAEPAAKLAAYAVVDAGLSYAMSGWESRFALNNILDKRYYPDANDLTRVTPGEPRNWRLSLSRKF
jgi:iron complex outermembrane receptor protein